MSIQWGSWVSSRFRVGLDLSQSPSTVTSSTSTVTVTAKLYWQTYYYGWDSGINWTITGAAGASGTTSFDHNSDMQYTFMGQVSKTVTPVVTGSITSTFSGSGTGWSAYSGTATCSDSITTARKPYTIPAAPTSVGVTRVSDTSHTVTWTRNATTAAPYENLYVERWDNVSAKYALIATVAGSATSYSNTNTVANRQYRYRVRARNDAGYSGYNYSGYIKTTPAAPGTPTAAKDASGNIVLTWSGNSAIAENIEVWHAANGVWDGTALATLGVVTTYTHVAPNTTVTHAYRLRSKIATPALTSGYSGTSNTVQLLSPPNAPTGLSPNGVTLDATKTIAYSWQHNSVDTTPQKYREFRYQVDGGAWTSTGKFASTSSTRTGPTNEYTNGNTIGWQVRTWGSATTGGSDGTGASPWSTTATIVTSSQPTVTINTPDDVTPVNTSTLTVDWGYFDAEGSTQTSWKVWLYDSSGAQVAFKQADSADTITTFSYTLQDGASYSVAVQVRDSTGSWSEIATQPFTVAFSKPPTPTMTLTWQEETGLVDILNAVPSPGAGEVAAVSVNIYRSVDGGLTYVKIATGVAKAASWSDYVPPLNSTVYYMVEAISSIPSAKLSAPVSIFTSSLRYKRSWLNVGIGFERGVYLSPNTTMTVASERDRTLYQFAGRELPVEFSGTHLSRVIEVKGVLVRATDDQALVTPEWDEIEDAIINYSAPACLRDLRGHRWFVSVDSANWAGPTKRIQDVGFRATQIDWAEDLL